MMAINALNRWLAPPLVALLLAGGTLSTALASTSASPSAAVSCLKEKGRPPDRPIPQGQLTRRGVVGTVDGLSEDGNLLVRTKWGLVEIALPEGFEGTVEVGSRIAALMEKAETDTPITVDPTEAATDTPFRTGSALKLKVVPTKATLSHERGVVVSQDGDNVGVVDEDGEMGDAAVTGDGGDQIEDGTDAVLLTKCSGPGAKAEIRNIQRADKIAERLERLQAKFADDPEKAAKLDALVQKQQDKLEARLAKTTEKAPPGVKDKANKALGKAKGECPEGEVDCPDGGGGNKGGGDQGGGDQGGGNQGGGKDKDKDKK